MKTLDQITGTQSIARAFAILRSLSRFGGKGMPLRQVARSNGLTSATAHRILQQLIREGAVVQRENSDYAIGPMLAELGIAPFSRDAIIAACRSSIEALAAETTDTVFLILQSGGDGICLDRVDATGIVRVITLEVGERRPLSDSAAGLAILSRMDEDQAVALVERSGLNNARYAKDLASVRASIEDARAGGYAFVQRDDVGISAVGIAVPTPEFGLAISLSSTSARLELPRRAEVIRALRKAIRTASEKLGDISRYC